MSCHPFNSVKSLKALVTYIEYRGFSICKQTCIGQGKKHFA